MRFVRDRSPTLSWLLAALLRFYSVGPAQIEREGNSGRVSGGGSGLGPAVCPNGRKRASRRLSASYAFTGKRS